MTEGVAVRKGFEQATTIARYELLRFYNSLRITGILAIFVVLAALILLIPTALGDPYVSSLRLAEAFGFFVPLLAVALGLLFGADSLVREFTARTGYTLLPNPISRSTIVAGKFMAALLASWGALFVYYLITFVVSFAIFEQAAFDILPSFAYALLYTVAMLAFVFLISAVAPSVTSSVTAAFLVLVILFPWAGPQLRAVEVWNLAILTEAGSITHRLLDFRASIAPQALVDALVTVGLYSTISLLVATGVFYYRED